MSVQAIGFLLPLWETWMEFLSPSQPQPLWAFVERTSRWDHSISHSPPLKLKKQNNLTHHVLSFPTSLRNKPAKQSEAAMGFRWLGSHYPKAVLPAQTGKHLVKLRGCDGAACLPAASLGDVPGWRHPSVCSAVTDLAKVLLDEAQGGLRDVLVHMQLQGLDSFNPAEPFYQKA